MILTIIIITAILPTRESFQPGHNHVCTTENRATQREDKEMKRMIKCLGLMFLILCFATVATAADKGKSPIPGMTKNELVKLAKSAAPASIADQATVMIPGAAGEVGEAVKGTNGF